MQTSRVTPVYSTVYYDITLVVFYTTVKKFGVSEIFLMFLKQGFYNYQVCIYLLKNTVKAENYFNLK